LGEGAYNNVFLVKKKAGPDEGKLYTMKTMVIAAIMEDRKGLERHNTECYIHRNVMGHPVLLACVTISIQNQRSF
jgi:hypothetical protein